MTNTAEPIILDGSITTRRMSEKEASAARTVDTQLKIVNPLLRELGLPTYGSDEAAGVDLRACIERPIVIEPARRVLIPTGIAIQALYPGFAAFVFPRSGLGHKHGLICGNAVGVIDADYQGEIMVSAWNSQGRVRMHGMGVVPDGNPITINPGDRIAQLVLMPVFRFNFIEVEEFEDKTERAAGGFGSTGVQ